MMLIDKTFTKIASVLIILFVFVVSTFAQKTNIRIAFVGNSITAGVYGYGLIDEHVSYATQFSELLEEYVDKLETFNAGISGCTLTKNTNSSIWAQSKFQNALSWAPEVCLIALGTNDSKPSRLEVVKNDFFNDYQDMIDQFRSFNQNVTIIACLPPPIFEGHPYSSSDPHSDDILSNFTIPLIDSIAKVNNLMVVDFHTPFKDSIKYFDDQLHPNKAGHKKMANILFDRFIEEGLVDTGSTAATINYDKSIDQMSIYPNPVNNSCTVNIPDNIMGTIAITVFDQNGAPIISCNNIIEKKYVLNVSNLLEGFYIITIQSDDQVITDKLIIVK